MKTDHDDMPKLDAEIDDDQNEGTKVQTTLVESQEAEDDEEDVPEKGLENIELNEILF